MSLVQFEVKNRVGYITLNRPEKRNALSFDFVTEIKKVFTGAENNADVKVIVLKANGDAFCAGADLAYIQGLQTNTFEENVADSTHLMELFKQIYLSKKVVMSQVEGAALAGGCGLATVCDFCFSVPEASFGYTEVKIGFVPAIVKVFLVRKVGEGKAKEILLTGGIFDGLKAREYGLVNYIIPPDLMEGSVTAFAEKLCATTSANSLALVKEMLNEVQNLSLDEGLEYAANMNAKARESEDCKKGIAAFLNKEKITW